MKTIEINLYKFAELSDEAKKAAIENCRNDENYLDYEWYDGIFEDATTAGKLLGIDVENIYFRGFSSQGDGACFEGYYKYAKGSVKAIKEYAPKDETLNRIAVQLAELQRKNFYQIGATVKHTGRYTHENSTTIDVYKNETNDWFSNEIDDQVQELLKDFMRWIYSSLDADYDYLNSDESIAEHLTANDYDFTEDGELY